MKKLILSLVLLLSIFTGTLTAQVTIGSLDEPDHSAALDLMSTSRGFLAPRLTNTQRDNIVLPAKGLTIYNVTENCIQVNHGTPTSPEWFCCCSDLPSLGAVSQLLCSSIALSPDMPWTKGTPVLATLTVPYTGGNGGAYTKQVLISTGVAGLKATRWGGNLAEGDGTITYEISGTPTGWGTASFNISLGEKACTFTHPVINVEPNVDKLVCESIDISPKTAWMEGKPVNATITVPYNGGNGGDYGQQTLSSTGVTGLTAVRTAGALNNGDGTITYKVSGTPNGHGYANFTVKLGNKTCTLKKEVEDKGGRVSLDCENPDLRYIGSWSSGTNIGDDVWLGYKFTGLTGYEFPNASFSSTGVTGLTATFNDTYIDKDEDIIWFKITGTPNGKGDANFTVTVGGESCTFTKYVPDIPANPTSLICSSIELEPKTDWTQGEPVTATLTVPYTGGNGGEYGEQTILSTEVTGLTAVRPAGAINNGNGTITYQVTGTPDGHGQANFTVKLGNKTCTFTKKVNNGPARVKLDCEAVTISPNSGWKIGKPVNATITVEYTGGNGGEYGQQTVQSTGVTGLTAVRTAGVVNNGYGTITYKVTGTPNKDGNANFAINLGDESCTIKNYVQNIDAEPDELICGSITLDPETEWTIGKPINTTLTVPYTGGNGGDYGSEMLISTGIEGVIALREKGTISSSGGTITYKIMGTPTSYGSLSFAIGLGSKTCTFTKKVKNIDAKPESLICELIDLNPKTDWTKGTPVDATITVPYTGGNGGYYGQQILNSTGVTGLTAVRTEGVINNGNGTITYKVTGTPTDEGYASFTVSLGDEYCTFTKKVKNIGAEPKELECGAIDLIPDIDWKEGTPVTATLIVPYTDGNGGDYSDETLQSTGVTGLTAVRTSGTIHNGDGTITYQITGTPTVVDGDASFAVTLGSKTCTFKKTVNKKEPIIDELECGNVIVSPIGEWMENVPVNATITVPYKGGNGGYYGQQTLQSIGVTGLTAVRTEGRLNNGDGTITYQVTGTPTGNGDASFIVTLGGKACTFTRTVEQWKPTITELDCDWINITPYESWKVGEPVNATITVPYTSDGNYQYEAQSVTSTGVTGLTATRTAGSTTNGNGTITYTVTGTPNQSGIARFVLGLDDKVCAANLRTWRANEFGVRGCLDMRINLRDHVGIKWNVWAPYKNGDGTELGAAEELSEYIKLNRHPTTLNGKGYVQYTYTIIKRFPSYEETGLITATHISPNMEGAPTVHLKIAPADAFEEGIIAVDCSWDCGYVHCYKRMPPNGGESLFPYLPWTPDIIWSGYFR